MAQIGRPRHARQPDRWGLAYGLLFAIAGDVILIFAWRNPYLSTAALSGFFLIAPLLAGGLYEISRRQANGVHSTLFSIRSPAGPATASRWRSVCC